VKKRSLWFILLLGCTLLARAEVTSEAITALGVTEGKAQANGFVFFDGRYIQAPYTISRRGNGLYVNRFAVLESSEWATLRGAHRTQGKFLDEDGDFEIVASTEAHGDAQNPDLKKQCDALRAKIDGARENYEQALSKGSVLFFSRDGRVKVENNANASKLMLALPKALEGGTSAKQLQELLQQSGVFFVDAETCAGLCRNPLNAQLINERLAEFRAATKRVSGSSK